MEDDALFSVEPVGPVEAGSSPAGLAPRVQTPQRFQVEMHWTDLDSLVAEDHTVRIIWDYVDKIDLSALYARIRSLEGRAGRTPIDPKILLALWLYATLRAVGSARTLNELCENHVVYRWLCGGVGVNYHTLADFRSEAGDILNDLLIDHVAKLCAAGLVTMDRVAHDGMRVRASAGSSSFRRKETLERFREEVKEQVDVLRRELHDDPAASSKRQKAARQRAVKEREERVAAALKQYPDVHAKKKHDKDQARVSTTDPDARKMHMPDGGCRPAYNVQLSADTGSQIIVSADVIQSGSDHAQMLPALKQIQAQTGCTPKEALFDGGFAKPADIETLSQPPYECKVYAPPTEFKDKDGSVKEPPHDEGPGAKAWRERMKSDEGKTIYRERASTIECVNALARNRGLQQFRVRGIEKVRAVVLLFALAHNLMREESLKQEAAARQNVKPNTG